MATAPPETEPKKKSKKKLIAIGLVVVIAAAGAYLVLGKKKAAPAAGGKPVPGQIVTESALTVNLAGGHYLQVAPALQLVAGESPSMLAPDAPKIDDTVIDVFAGQSMDALATPSGIRTAKHRLLRALAADYPGKVLGIYFTQFVMQ